MISILANGPAEAEYYAARRGTILFANHTQTKRAKPTYDINGRVYIQDKPSVNLQPNDMWHNLLFRAKSTATLNTVLQNAGVGDKQKEQSLSRKASLSSNDFLVIIDKQPTSAATGEEALLDDCSSSAIKAQRLLLKRRSSTTC
uniref:TDP43_N domain-containing protein n=1 Tax=Syphacia muris TaxID=451379 RepID=A0A0N5AQX0_9BILA